MSGDDEVCRRPFRPTAEEMAARMRGVQTSMRQMQDSLDHMIDAIGQIQVHPWPTTSLVASGGWSAPAEYVYELAPEEPEWNIGYRTDNQHHRKGDETALEALHPGTKVYVLEGVFTVDRVELEPIRTVWLVELPTSPLYFEAWEWINLATEEED